MLRCFSKLKGYEGWLLAQMNWHVTALSGKEAKQQPNIVRAEKKYQTEEPEMETTEKPVQINWQRCRWWNSVGTGIRGRWRYRKDC